MKEPNGWPSDKELVMFTREASEHCRAWAFIAGLSKSLIAERRAYSEHAKRADKIRPENYTDRIHDLETKVIKQKAALQRLEECRVFEAETERLLVDALVEIRDGNGSYNDSAYLAQRILVIHERRKGPRDGNV
jgi:hypothetical protein